MFPQEVKIFFLFVKVLFAKHFLAHQKKKFFATSRCFDCLKFCSQNIFLLCWKSFACTSKNKQNVLKYKIKKAKHLILNKLVVLFANWLVLACYQGTGTFETALLIGICFFFYVLKGSCSVPADSDDLAIDVSVLLCGCSAGSVEADQASRRWLHQSSLESQRPPLPLHSGVLLQERQEPSLQVSHAVIAYQSHALYSSLCNFICFSFQNIWCILHLLCWLWWTNTPP